MDATSERIGLLVSSDPQRVEEWAHALDEAGIDALVEITDRQIAQPGNSPLAGVLGTMPLDFVHVLTVHPQDRQRALAVLVDAGWDGREGRTWRRASSNVGGVLSALGMAVGALLVFALLRIVFS